MEKKESAKGSILTAILGIGLVLVALALAANVGNNTQTEKNTISVSGSGMVTASPDQAELFVEVQVKEDTAERARSESASRVARVISALKQQGVKSSNIETASINIFPLNDYDRNTGRSTVYAYQASHVLKVTTKDIDRAGKLLDTAVSNGASIVQQVRYTLSSEKEKEISADALKKAGNDASAKAEAIAKTLNVRLGRVAAVSESNVNYRPIVNYRTQAATLDEAYADTPVQPQDVDVSAFINIQYHNS